MKYRVVLVPVLVIAGACGRGPAVPEPEVPSATPALEQPASAVWEVAYERALGWRATPAVYAPDDRSILTAGMRFDRDGRFLGAARLHVPAGRMVTRVHAVLGGGLALASAKVHERGDVVLVGRLDRPPEEALHRLDVDRLDGVAVSPAGDRVVLREGDAVVVRSLPAFEEISRLDAPAGPASHHRRVAALPGGGVAYTVPANTCNARCSEAGLVVARDGEVHTLRAAGVAGLAFSGDGDVAALVAADGVVVVVDLESGAALASIAEVRGEIEVAVGTRGERLAVGTCDAVRLYERHGDEYRLVLHQRYATGSCDLPAAVTLGDDELAVVGAGHLSVFRRGAARTTHPIAYEPALPAGFELTEHEHLWQTVVATGWSTAPRRHAGYFHDHEQHTAEVRVVVRDATQLAHIEDLEAWSEAVLVRFERDLTDPDDPTRLSAELGEIVPYRHAFIDARGRRQVEYAVLVRAGCEPTDSYVRYVEDGDALLEITLETFPNALAALAGRWLAALFDEPLGPVPAKRRLARLSTPAAGC